LVADGAAKAQEATPTSAAKLAPIAERRSQTWFM
jgi:hypothetical protein